MYTKFLFRFNYNYIHYLTGLQNYSKEISPLLPWIFFILFQPQFLIHQNPTESSAENTKTSRPWFDKIFKNWSTNQIKHHYRYKFYSDVSEYIASVWENKLHTYLRPAINLYFIDKFCAKAVNTEKSEKALEGGFRREVVRTCFIFILPKSRGKFALANTWLFAVDSEITLFQPDWYFPS